MKRLLLVFLFCLVCHPAFLFSQSTFIRSLSLYGDYAQTALHPATDGFVHANVKNLGTNYYPAFAILDSLGQSVQTRTTSTALSAFGYPADLIRLAGGGYAAAYIDAPITLVFTLDSTGLPIAYQRSSSFSYFQELEPTPDGGYLAMGYSLAVSGQTWAGWLAKFDAQGDTLWTRSYELPNGGARIKDASVLPSGDYILLADFGQSLGLMRVSSGGQMMWAKKYPVISGSQFFPRKIALNADGQILAGGTLIPQNYAAAAAFDTLGHLQWSTQVLSPTGFELWGGTLTPQGDLLLTGKLYEYIAQQAIPHGMSLRFSKTGNVIWLHRHLFDNNPWMSDVECLPGGGYFWTGADSLQTLFYKTTDADSIAASCSPESLHDTSVVLDLDTVVVSPLLRHRDFLTRPTFTTAASSATSSLRCGTVGVAQGLAAKAATVVPQPLHSAARILLAEGSLADDAQLHITDLSGRHLALPTTRLSDGWEIQRGGLPAGIYVYQVLQDGQRIASGKLWVAD
jgi:hypothetical protein